MNIVFRVYLLCASTIGTVVILSSLIALGHKIYHHFKMKKIVKEYTEKLKESNFLQDIAAKMTDEEKELMDKNKKVKTEIKLYFDSMKATKKTK